MRTDTVRSLASLRVRDVQSHDEKAKHFPDLPSALAAFDSWQAREGIKQDVQSHAARILNK